MKNLTTFLLVLAALGLSANNIQISNTKLTGQNTAEGYTLVQFDLSWENSWRTSSAPNNWDAAWVFVKYRITAANGGDDLWKHARLHNNGHSGGTGAGATIDAGLLTPGNAFDANTNPGIGVFIYRSANGTGAFSVAGAQLRWNYSANGVADDDLIEIKVFAIEMVYVPQGSFYLGSGGGETAAFYRYPTTTNTFQVTSENAITVGTTNDNLYYPSTTYGGDQGGPIPADFPEGYTGFYCQKYEITQQQYVDFLNTLTYMQQNNRIDGNPNDLVGTFTRNANRHKIKIQASGVNPDTPAVYETEHPYVACNYLNWMDGCAYADWAGLRPMTEMEYEKACRGTATPVPNEYAWGNTTIAAATGISNGGASNETPSNSGANAVYGSQTNVQGPMRVGVFAKSGTTRAQSGASYYGIMELSGNLWERPVTVGNATGRAFTGVHGNGALSANGHADPTAWPEMSSGEVTGANGSGFRGGSCFTVASRLLSSDRGHAADPYSVRGNNYGFRGIRSWPFVCGESQITDIDGNTYNTVQIGNQCWMAENLKTTTYKNSTAIPNITDNTSWSNLSTDAYAWWDNDIGWKAIYGGLYNWYAVNNGNLCPEGWSVPDDTDWTVLVDYVVSQGYPNNWTNPTGAGNALKSCRQDGNPAGGDCNTTLHPRWNSHGAHHGFDAFGFSAFGGGIRNTNGSFHDMGGNGSWWTSTQISSTDAWMRYMYYNGADVGRQQNNKGHGFPVRCLKDID